MTLSQGSTPPWLQSYNQTSHPLTSSVSSVTVFFPLHPLIGFRYLSSQNPMGLTASTHVSKQMRSFSREDMRNHRPCLILHLCESIYNSLPCAETDSRAGQSKCLGLHEERSPAHTRLRVAQEDQADRRSRGLKRSRKEAKEIQKVKCQTQFHLDCLNHLSGRKHRALT